ncbi:unnamed protein product, partial [Rhizoctonia solani]
RLGRIKVDTYGLLAIVTISDAAHMLTKLTYACLEPICIRLARVHPDDGEIARSMGRRWSDTWARYLTRVSPAPNLSKKVVKGVVMILVVAVGVVEILNDTLPRVKDVVGNTINIPKDFLRGICILGLRKHRDCY